jgi:hypothetical protein
MRDEFGLNDLFFLLLVLGIGIGLVCMHVTVKCYYRIS